MVAFSRGFGACPAKKIAILSVLSFVLSCKRNRTEMKYLKSIGKSDTLLVTKKGRPLAHGNKIADKDGYSSSSPKRHLVV